VRARVRARVRACVHCWCYGKANVLIYSELFPGTVVMSVGESKRSFVPSSGVQ